MTYNGWTNYDTWNVVLWFDNDGEGLAEYVAEFARDHATYDVRFMDCTNCAYCGLIESLNLADEMTPDRVAWLSPNLDHDELHAWLYDKRNE